MRKQDEHKDNKVWAWLWLVPTTVFAMLFLLLVAYIRGENSGQRLFVETHRDGHPVCMERSVELIDKTLTLRRCWQLQETTPTPDQPQLQAQ